MCDRWHCPPSVVLAEDAGVLFPLLEAEALGKPPQPGGGNGSSELEGDMGGAGGGGDLPMPPASLNLSDLGGMVAGGE